MLVITDSFQVFDRIILGPENHRYDKPPPVPQIIHSELSRKVAEAYGLGHHAWDITHNTLVKAYKVISKSRPNSKHS